jgi:hypothetical protein
LISVVSGNDSKLEDGKETGGVDALKSLRALPQANIHVVAQFSMQAC